MVKIFDIKKEYKHHPGAEKPEILRFAQNDGTTAQNNRYCLKTAFTLAEVLVAMLIMSLFFMATTKVISVKQKPLIQEHPHGYYECYTTGGLREHRVDAGHDTIAANTSVGRCSFEPQKGLPVFNVYIVHPTRGYYATTESQITENAMTFNGADDLLNIYSNTFDTPSDANNAFWPNDLSSKVAQFKQFLRLSYPQSVLSSNWSGTNPPFPAVFITW